MLRPFLPSALFLVLAFTGCDPKPDDTGPEADADTDTDADSDTDADADADTDADADWTPGPDLPDCTPQAGDEDLVALSGVVLLPEGPAAGHVVYRRSTGRLECAGATCDTSGATVVCTEGVISPGLIDPHVHLQYNLLGVWRHDALYADRYDWQSDGDYWDFRTAYDEVSDSYNCEIMKWAELRELVAGATSAVGSYGDACIDRLIRNLDEDSASHGISGYESYYTASNVTDRFDAADGADFASDLASGVYGSVLAHVAEGVTGSVTAEIDHMFDIGMSGPGFGFIHATDATVEQLAQMAADGTTIVWSPRSNIDLYADATPVDVARRLGVPVAISTDWTWSGSANAMEELSCAWDWLGSRRAGVSDVELWSWATSEAARAVGLEGVLGTLDAGLLADIAVYDWSAEPYRAVIQGGPETVRLTIIDGQAIYGLTSLVPGLAEYPDWCEVVEACDHERTLCVQSAASGEHAQTYAEIEATLVAALAAESVPSGYEYAKELFPLWLCEDDRPSCDLSEPTAGDADGDGIADAEDLCPDAWDPRQGDHDGDGTGDACDPCPLDPDSDDCAPGTSDVDGDGYANDDDNCPWVSNPDQADRDRDGKGDACDPCPDEANPGDEGCSFTVRVLQDESDPAHPPEGTSVTLEGLVVTAIRSGYGYYAQDPDETEWAGIFIYDRGDAAVSEGDVVTVSGEYVEYYDLCEVSDAVTTVTGSRTVPGATVAEACDVATGAVDSERYESMLVRVEDVSVTSANPDGASDYGEMEVAGCLRVDDLLFAELDTAPEGYRTLGRAYDSITGILNFSYENTKVLPRRAADLVGAR